MRPMPKRSGSKFTAEIINFIKVSNIRSSQELSGLIHSHYGVSFSPLQINKAKWRHGIVCANGKKKNAPLYSEYTEKKGKIFIKISCTGTKEDWKLKHHWIWEQANGEIPEGYEIIFLDNNKLNFNLENLAMVSQGEKLKLTQFNLRFNDAELTKTGLAIVRHKSAVFNALTKGLNREERRRKVDQLYKKNKQHLGAG